MGRGGGVNPGVAAIVRKHTIEGGIFIVGEIAPGYNKIITYAGCFVRYRDRIGAGAFFSLNDRNRTSAGIVMQPALQAAAYKQKVFISEIINVGAAAGKTGFACSRFRTHNGGCFAPGVSAVGG